MNNITAGSVDQPDQVEIEKQYFYGSMDPQ